MKNLSTRGKWTVLGIVTALVLLVGSSFLFLSSLLEPDSQYPTQGWQSSTPEEQGFDSAKLAQGLGTIKGNGTPIHSLMIVRHGSPIVDATFYPYNSSTYHDVASVTKSVMTTLIGIAADQGKLALDQPAVSFFPGRAIANRDPRKERITVRNLVSMSSGLDCTAEEGEKTLQEMKDSADWIQFVLDRKLIYEPGTHFEYCSPGMHLLSAILQQATGKAPLEYARINLFEPLGIHNVYWPADPQGYTHGWGDLALYPQDMARLGYLFLHQGRWDGKQIISREWIHQATQRQIETGASEDYGYGWWVSRPNADVKYYLADGRGGQRIMVIPPMDLVLVTTGGGYDFGDIEKYIKAAIGNLEKPLPSNPAGVERLQAVLSDLALPPAVQAVPPLPKTAVTISGQVFVLEANPLSLRSVRLDFGDPSEAILQLDIPNEAGLRSVGVGLDGIYRSSHSGGPTLAKGEWAANDTFVIDYNEGPGLAAFILRMHFNDARLVLQVSDPTQGINLSIEGKAG